ncbi:MAG TPA: hypothetical protein ENN79_10940 [Desulfobacteraceae bacterium]|nr:hypothetical protein [Desulfobacteraceae bacterium]
MEQLEEIVEEVKRQFDGRDPVQDALERIDRMNHTELKALIFIAANKLARNSRAGSTMTLWIHCFTFAGHWKLFSTPTTMPR